MALPFPSTMPSLNNVMLRPLGEAKQVRYLCEKQGNSPAEKSQSKNRTISCMWGREGEVGQNGVTKPDYEKGEKGSIYSGQAQRVKDKVEWKCLSGGVKVSRVRKVSKSGMMSKPKWMRKVGFAICCPAQYPSHRTCYEEQSCWTAPRSLTLESTATFTPGHASSRLLPANDWTWWEYSNSQLWMGDFLHIKSCVDICFSGDWIDSECIPVLWCQKLLRRNKKSSGRCFKMTNFIKRRSLHSRMFKEHFLLHKEIQWLSREKFSTGYLSWKGPFKTAEG